MNVELRDEARDDLVNGAVFYREQSVGLDEYFLKCLREDVKKLETTGALTGSTVDFTGHYRIVSLMQSTIWFLKTSSMSSQFWIAVETPQRSTLDSDVQRDDDDEQLSANRVRNRREAGQQGCGGLESDQRLVERTFSSTALFGFALVATQSCSHRDKLECRKDKDFYVAEFAKNFGFSKEIIYFRKSWRLPLRLSLRHSGQAAAVSEWR